MAGTAVVANQGQQGGGGGGGAVPFLVGSQLYREQPFYTQTLTPGASQQTFTPVPNITPGNFLNGVVVEVTSTGGVLGTTATVNTAGALLLLSQISLTDTGGGEILYPLSAFTYAMAQKWLRPWCGDPQKRPGYSNTINPAFTLRFSVAIRDTLCTLSNTDARTQYRMNMVLAPLTTLVSVSTGVTAPAVTVNLYIDAWAEPDAVDLSGRPIAPLPPGLGAAPGWHDSVAPYGYPGPLLRARTCMPYPCSLTASSPAVRPRLAHCSVARASTSPMDTGP